jgi:hypothetical protein
MASYSAEMPPEKQKAVQAAANWTMPPVQGTPIPWIDRAYTGPRSTATPDPPAGLSECSAAQVQISFAGWNDQDELGSVGWVVARNTGSRACIITGPPHIDLVDGTGRTLATASGGDGATDPAVLRPALPPHPSGSLAWDALGKEYLPGYAYGEIRVSGFCDSAATLRVELPNGARGDLAVPPQPSKRCVDGPGQATDWYFHSVEQSRPTTFSSEALVAYVWLPDEAVVGRPLNFTVALQNMTRLSISLDPCPSYAIGVTVQGPKAIDSRSSDVYALNCDSAATIPAGSAVAFDMQAVVPADTPLVDTVYVSWTLGTLDRPSGTVIMKNHGLKLRAP